MPIVLPAVSSAVIAAVVWRTWMAWRLEREVAARLPLADGGVVRGAEPIALEGVGRIARWHRLLSICTAYLRGRGERSIHDPVERERALSYRATTPRLLYEL